MEISAVKSKIMVNSRIAPITTILLNGESLQEATSFKYLGSIISFEGDSTEKIPIRKKTGNISDIKIQEDMEQRQHRHGNKDTTLVVEHGCVSADIRMRKLDPESRVRKKSSRI